MKTMQATPANNMKFLDLLRAEGFRQYIIDKVDLLLAQKSGTVRTADVIEEAWELQHKEDQQMIADIKAGLRDPEEITEAI
jgi:hypothetical protein